MAKDPPVPITEIDDNNRNSVIMMLYGDNGTGKTRILGTIGKRGIFLNIGDGDMTLKSPDFKKLYGNDLPKFASIQEELDPATGIYKIPAKAFDLVTDFVDWFVDQDEYDTLAIDDQTALNAYAINKTLDYQQDQKSVGVTSRDKASKAGFVMMMQYDYNPAMNMINWFYDSQVKSRFKAKNKNFILAAHERHIYEKTRTERGEIIETLKAIRPGFFGKVLPNTIEAHFDFVWRTEVVNGKRFRAATIPNGYYAAKTRWSGFQEYEYDVNFQNILKRVKGEI